VKKAPPNRSKRSASKPSRRRSSKAKRANGAAASASRDKTVNGLTEGDATTPAKPPREALIYQRMLRAAISLVDAGKAVTYGNLASELGRAKQVVWRFVQRHPDVWTYINAHIEEANAQFAGLVLRRHAFIGMQGSVPSAELYLKAQGGHFSRPAMLGADGMPLGAVASFNMNFLIPRPEPIALAPTALPPAPVARPSKAPQPSAAAAPLIPRPSAARPDIPTVAIR
jgi:hypothetical protein